MGYIVMNKTDGIIASSEEFETKEQAEKFIKKFRDFFENTQGYYKTARCERINPEDIELDIEEV